MLTLAAPWWLAALPLPWLAWRMLRRRTPSHVSAALVHSQADLLARLAARRTASSHAPWLWLLGCMALIIALARPQWTLPDITGEHYGRDFMIAIDVSGSMRALDFTLDGAQVDRLTLVKQLVDGFLDERRGDRVGIIVFADDAYSLAPVTTDKMLLKQILNDVDTGMIGEQTALGNALALAVKRLRERREEARVLILLTDGTNTAGDITPETALVLARHYRVRVYAIGIGAQQPVAFPRGRAQTPELTELPVDEALLQRIADDTGGRYFAVRSGTDLQRVLREIDGLADVPIRDPQAQHRLELYWPPLLAGLLLLLAAQWRAARRVLPATPLV